MEAQLVSTTKKCEKQKRELQVRRNLKEKELEEREEELEWKEVERSSENRKRSKDEFEPSLLAEKDRETTILQE